MKLFRNLILFGILFSLNNVLASTMTLKLTNSDLKIKGEMSFYENKPIIISGFDGSNQPYTLKVETKSHGKNVLQLVYKLDRNGKIQSGSIIQEKGKLASIASAADDKNSPSVTFEVLITD